MAEIAYGSGSDPDLPQLELPSFDNAPQQPVQITVHPRQREDVPLPPERPTPIHLVPVEHTPDFSPEPAAPMTLHPVDHVPDFSDEPDMNALGGGDYGGAYRTFIDPMIDMLKTPGRLMHPRQNEPRPGQMWSDEDEARRQFENATHSREETDFGAGTALGMIGIGANIPATPGELRIFGGAKAKTADLAALTLAKRLETGGVEPTKIWQETGWFKGADNEWRFEIPDQNARLIPRVDPARTQRMQEISAEKQALADKRASGEKLTPEDRHRWDALYEEEDSLGRAQNGFGKAPQVLEHPALYEAYPDAANLPFRYDEVPGERGHFSSTGRGELVLSTHPSVIEATGAPTRQTALHEMQHYVQNQEGFSPGGSYSTPEVAGHGTELEGKRTALKNELQQLLYRRDRAVDLKVMAAVNEAGAKTVHQRAAIGSDFNRQKYADEFWAENPDLARRLNEIHADAIALNQAHHRALREAYMRLAGETEARNVELRSSGPNSEPPWETEDRPREQQIIRKPEKSVGPQSSMLEPAGETYGRQRPPVGEEADAAVQPGGPGGAASLAEAQGSAARAAGSVKPIEGLPNTNEPLIIRGQYYVPGPLERVHRVAEQYMRDAGLPYEPLQDYVPVDKVRAGRIAKAFDEMKHDPENPQVKAAYDAMINETVAQLKALQKDGLKIEFIKPGQADPYYESPRLATQDLRDNNHLWVFPTDLGFGTVNAITDNPLLRKTGINIDGRELLANDAFRIVHDYFGHFKDGLGFRAGGEENAWRSHSRMYSPLARRAMTTETRGQNSWLNYGPHGTANRVAKADATIYADQKIGLLPEWVTKEGAENLYRRPTNDAGNPVINAGVDSPPNRKLQTVADPHRMMFPGIYENPRRIAREASERVGEEDPAMKQLWGVSRGDLDEMAKGRVGNEEPNIKPAPKARGSLAAQNIQTPRNTQRLVDTLAEAGKHPGLAHADAWYIMDPVYQQLDKMFGPEEAKRRFNHLNTMIGIASPGSEVASEIQRGTAAHWLEQQGRFDDFERFAGVPEEFRRKDFPKDMRYIKGHPYHRTSQAEPMSKYLEHGAIQSDAVKVPLYVQASGTPKTGFQTSAPVGDSHFSRGVGLADTRKGPTDVASSLSAAELRTLQPWWKDEIAGEVGLESVPAQARLWTAMGPRTGVESELGRGKLEIFSQQIMKAAKRMGISPEKARDMILSGKAGAGALGGALGIEQLLPYLQDDQR